MIAVTGTEGSGGATGRFVSPDRAYLYGESGVYRPADDAADVGTVSDANHDREQDQERAGSSPAIYVQAWPVQGRAYENTGPSPRRTTSNSCRSHDLSRLLRKQDLFQGIDIN